MKYILAFFSLLLLNGNCHAQKSKSTSGKRVPIDTIRFVFVEGGTYPMGTIKPIEPHEAPEHIVSVFSFYLAKTEITFDEYDKFCASTKRDTANARGFGRGKQPAITVSWNDAINYCNWLSDNEKLSKCYSIDSSGVKYLDTANGYRLPTEAEWEFAARGGNKTKGTYHAGSNDMNEVGWYKLNSNERTMPVALKIPNELGIYDMTGNVWEWVWDFYDAGYYSHSTANNPQGPETGQYRVMRGGAFYNYANYTQVYTRQNHFPGFMQNSVGFRIARNFR
jgi:sulfatase modifying factor 1